MMLKRTLLICLPAMLLFVSSCKKDDGPSAEFTSDVISDRLEATLKVASGGVGLSYYTLPESNELSKIPQDPLNPLSSAKVELGQLLFHDAVLAQNPRNVLGAGSYSCASCHHAWAGFQAGLPQGLSEGGVGFGLAGEGRVKNSDYAEIDMDTQPLRTPSALNSAYQTNNLWNGQFGATGVNVGTNAVWTVGTPIETNNLGYEGVETQAIAGLGVHRMDVLQSVITQMPEYVQLFESAFPNWANDRRYSKEGAGLAIAAYERTLLPTESPFQLWLKGNKDALTNHQKAGAILFFGKAECSTCHNGPALANMEFHVLGMKDFNPGEVFNLPAGTPANKGRGSFTQNSADDYAFKVPQLYNLTDSRFYGHGASFTSVSDVIKYKNSGLKENSEVPDGKLSAEFKPLGLTDDEIAQLTDFIENGLSDPGLLRYVPSSLPSGACFPNNDPQSRADRGCD